MNEPLELCADCQALLERSSKDRHAAGHSNLTAVGERRDIAPYGWRADEQDYTCRGCGHKWMHETGNYGYGWVLQGDS